MAFARPTLGDLVTRIQLDFISRLGLVGAILRRSFVYVISRVMAGAAHMLHGHLEYLGQQLFPDQSDAEFLVRQAGVYGLSLIPPVYARAQIRLYGTVGATGVVVPAGTKFLSAASLEYSLDADVSVTYGSTPCYGNVTAVVAGSAGTLAIGALLTMESPISLVTAAAPVVVVTANGADVETSDALRARLLAHLAQPAAGGNQADYIAWAKSISGVTRVWVTPMGLGPGTVLVYFMRDNDSGSPIPDSGEVAAVQAVFTSNAPVHATPTAAAPAAAPLNVTVHLVPDNSSTRAAVITSLTALLLNQAPAGTVLLSAVRTAIGTATGITDYALTVPSTDTTQSAGQIATLGAMTFV